MEKRILGRTGFEVTVLGMGGVGAKSETVRRALELGVNYVDTAPGYGNSEENIGIGLEGASQSYYIATKLGGRPKPFDAQDKDMLRRSVDESLRLLKRNSIDILQIHEPDHPSIFDWWTDYDNFHGPVCEVLEELKEEKIINSQGWLAPVPMNLHTSWPQVTTMWFWQRVITIWSGRNSLFLDCLKLRNRIWELS